MNDCEKCKYYHDNCDGKFRCRVDVEKIRTDAIDEFKTLFDKWLYEEYGKHLSKDDLVYRVAEQLKEQNNLPTSAK